MKAFHIVYTYTATVSTIKYFEDSFSAEDVEHALKNGHVDISMDDVIEEGPLRNLRIELVEP